MTPSGQTTLAGTYDYWLVALSVVIAICASYAALDLAGRVTAARGRARAWWLTGGASAMGLGSWSMHYIGMLAFSLPIAVSYDWPTVLVSLLAAMLASAVALYVVSRKTMGLGRAVAGSLMMGAGIAGMHYIGMAAMRLAAMCRYNVWLVTLSVVLAIVISFAALRLSFVAREEKHGMWRKFGSATVMGAAIPVMHYTGMAAASFTASSAAPDLSHAVSISTLGTAGITVVTLMVLALAVLTSTFNRRFSAQTLELEAAELRYRLLFEKSPQPMWVHDLQTLAFLAVNEAAVRQYGYSRKEFLRMTIVDLRPTEDISMPVAQEGRGLERARTQRHRKKSGRLIDVEITSHAFDWAGQPAQLVLATDVTERKRAEDGLRQLAAIVHSSDDAIIGKTADGIILSWNTGAQRIYGYTAEEMTGKPIDLLVPPDRPQEIPGILERIKAGKEVKNFETIRVRKDGKQIHIALTVSPVRDAAGKIVGASTITRDITERRRAEEDVRRLAAIVESSNDAIFSRTLEGVIQSWNAGAERLFGYTEKEAVGQSVSMLVLPERGANVSESLDRLRQGQRVEYFESVGVRKDGRKVQIAVTVSPVKNALGQIVGASTIARDITERKRAEEDLRRLVAAVEAAPDAMTSQTPDGTIVTWNKGAETVFGYSADEVIGKSIAIVCPADRAEETRAILGKVLRGETIEQFEAVRLRKDGQRIHVALTISPVKDAAGKVIAVLGIARDITERKRADQDLQRLAAAVDASPDAITTQTPEGMILSWNRGAEVIFGYSAAELIGKSIRILSPQDRETEVPEIHQKVKRGETIKQFETVRVRKDGKQIPVTLTIAPVKDAAGKMVAISGIAQDISERKQLEQQFRQAQKMEAVGRLSGGIAHDFNNLLGVIIGYSEVMEERLGENPALRKNAEEIKKAGRRAANLTRQLLAFSRQQMLNPKVLNLNGVVTDIEKMIRRLIGEDIELSTKLAPALGRVKADQGQVEQILMNLVVNARDAMPEGGKLMIETANAELDQEYARQHPGVAPGFYVLLTVTDTGTGMDAETQAHIFEPFFTTKETGKGTGLGLATVYGVVKQSGGYVWVYSERGQGTSFKIYLPQVGEPARPEESPAGTTKFVQGSETVLLVEDEDSLREIAHIFLSTSGYVVLVANSPARALEVARDHKGSIDLLLTDVVMPGMSGPELAAELVRARPELRVLFMSGYTGDSINRRGLIQPDMRAIQKPFTKDALLRTVRESLEVEQAPHPI
jgi:PAS domain S-box-containing protein